MTVYCRLCAELKDPDEIATSIDDVEQSMEQKLHACCQWTIENIGHRLPHNVCSICLDKLDKCWLFSQRVQLAQQKLLEIFAEQTPLEIVSSIKTENETDTEIEIEVEIKPLATEVEQIACDYGYSKLTNKLPSPRIDDKPIPNSKEKKNLKSNTKLPQLVCTNKIDPTNVELNAKTEHKCPECGKFFKKRWNLTEHIKRHSNDRPFECWLCHKTFQLKLALKEHLAIHVLSPKARRKIREARKQEKLKPKIFIRKLHSCQQCNKIFTHKTSLQEHLDTKHSNVYSFECCLCHKLFKTRRLLRSHVIVHVHRRVGKNKNKPQHCICELCGRIFTQRGRLNAHLQSFHSNLQRSYKCDICAMGYKTKRSLKSHQVMHMDYQYKCTECEKEFRKKTSLTKHMEYHRGPVAKPFVCDFCEKGFRFNANYAEHRRIHTGETPYECEYCLSKFRTMSSYYTHLKKAHGVAKSILNLEQRARITAMSTRMVEQPPEIPK